jgi:hypothetical protein
LGLKVIKIPQLKGINRTKPMDITIRRPEPGDYEAIARISTYPKVIWETLQVPFPSVEQWCKKIAEPPEGL